jgi:hypothetical protein
VGFFNPKHLFMSQEEIAEDLEESSSKSCGCAIMGWAVVAGFVAVPIIFFTYNGLVGFLALIGVYFLYRYGYVKAMGGSGISRD